MALTKGFKKFIGLVVVAVAVGGGLAFYKLHSGPQSYVQQATVSTSTATQASTDLQYEAPSARSQGQGQTVQSAPPADTLQSILQHHVVRISVENPSEPIYGESDGVPHGFNVDFAKLLFSQQEFSKNGPITVDTKHEVTAYADVPRQLLVNNNGPVVDIAMDGLTLPDNTPAGVVYTNPYLDDFGYALIVGPGSTIKSAADLNGKTIGILQGDQDVKAFVQRMFPSSTIKQVNDSDPQFIVKSLDNQTVDAFVYDYPFAVESIKDTDLKFAVTKIDGSDISYKIGVRASDQNLLIYLNSAIGRVKNSPEYLALLRRYFISNQMVTTAASSGERVYTVKPGDTLNLIASSQLGSGARYHDIQKRNNLPNPNLIQIGQRLVIPR